MNPSYQGNGMSVFVYAHNFFCVELKGIFKAYASSNLV